MEVQLVYNVVLISAVQQSDSVTYIYVWRRDGSLGLADANYYIQNE